MQYWRITDIWPVTYIKNSIYLSRMYIYHLHKQTKRPHDAQVSPSVKLPMCGCVFMPLWISPVIAQVRTQTAAGRLQSDSAVDRSNAQYVQPLSAVLPRRQSRSEAAPKQSGLQASSGSWRQAANHPYYVCVCVCGQPSALKDTGVWAPGQKLMMTFQTVHRSNKLRHKMWIWINSLCHCLQHNNVITTSWAQPLDVGFHTYLFALFFT